MPLARTAAASFALLLALPAAAAAAKLKVPSDYPTLQSAIVAAAPGDVIKVAAGTYHERIVIPASKVGLRVQGSGAVTLDATGTGSGAVVRVDAPAATVEKLTIAHAYGASAPSEGTGVHVTATATGAELRDLTIVRSERHGISVEAADVTVRSCRILGGEWGLLGHATADDCRVFDCEVLFPVRFGVELDGPRGRIEKNVVRGQSGDGGAIRIEGADSVVAKNVIESCEQGIQAPYSAARAELRQNEIAACRDLGVRVSGPDSRIESNEVSNCQGTGILLLSGTYLVVLKNDVRACRDGISLYMGKHNLVKGNKVRLCLRDGFVAWHGSDHLLVDNRAELNGVDGFDIESPRNELIENVALSNLGEGIENSGTETRLRKNEAFKNRIDVAMSQTPAAFEKNAYGTGGVDTAPELD